ncbi:MAG: hypothetical protein DHS20C14_21620 [Phycisphaeraceae bacterium]|nr:MAG: hypothetical protein DHS20C14_21620 [Phycisphaeraceae bacterium]
MRVVSRQADAVFEGQGWLPEMVSALDTHHLVAWSELTRRRNAFVGEVRSFLAAQQDTDACLVHGRSVFTLDDLCHQLERLVPVPELHRRLDGPDGVTELLRGRNTTPGRRAPRVRCWIWSDADVLLRSDPELFSSVVDCMLGVSAESEFGTLDGGPIQRVLFVGGPMLEAYARDRSGQFRSWAAEGDSEPFWKLVSGLERPPVVARPVDLLMRPPRRMGA